MRREVYQAYLRWVEAGPECECDTHGHYYRVKVEGRSKKLGKYDLIPRPDNEVCERERAWRAYVRLRGEAPIENKPKKKEGYLTETDINWLKSVKKEHYVKKKVW